MLLHIIAASIAFLAAFSFPQDQEIPPLTKDIVLELLRFELPEAAPDLISVLEVHQLDELGRANVKVGAVEATLRLQCQKTDFGPKWRLMEPLSPELKRAANPESPLQEAPPAEPQETQPETPLEPLDPTDDAPVVSYKNFLEKLFETVREERVEGYAEFFYRDEDFNLGAVAEEDPLKQLADRRAEFIRTCAGLSLQLRDAEQFDPISYFATRSSASDRAELRTLMPQARRYIKAVSVEVMVDGRLGTIIFEGLTLLQDGWRLGGIASVEIAPESETTTPLPQ